MSFTSLTRLKSFCGCISLRTGCLIIGYFETIGNALGLYNSFVSDEDWEDVILYILGVGFLLLLNAFMVYGIHNQKKKSVLPWLIVKFVIYVGLTIYYAIRTKDILSLLPYVEPQNLQIFIASTCCIFVTLLLLAWYTFLCVYSFYKTGFPEEKKPVEKSSHNLKKKEKVPEKKSKLEEKGKINKPKKQKAKKEQ